MHYSGIVLVDLDAVFQSEAGTGNAPRLGGARDQRRPMQQVLDDEDAVAAITSKVEEMMAPFYEGLEVPEYERPCYCVTHNAHHSAREALEAETGITAGDLRDLFHEIEREKYEAGEYGPWPRYEEDKVGWQLAEQAQTERWQAFSGDYFQREREIREELRPTAAVPDPECEDCHGTGIERVTYNPQGHWDWYRVGGRWDGELLALPAIDDGEGGFNFGDQFSTLERNAAYAGDVAERGYAPYFILTPTGEWHAHEVWDREISEWIDTPDWVAKAKALLEQYPNHLAVLVDAHN